MMNFKISHWERNDYERMIFFLKQESEEAYRLFQEKIVLSPKQILGVRLPKLRRYAKEIIKGNWNSYLKFGGNEYFEEVMLEGIVIGTAKMEYQERILLTDQFLSKIDSWAICDSFCNGFEINPQRVDAFFAHIETYLRSENPWSVRVGLVMMLSHYMKAPYIEEILKRSENIKNSAYYVKMANAWLISVAYINFKKQTLSFLRTSCLDDWTYHKSIQKIRESQRVSRKEKEMLKTLKRRH